MRTRLSPGALTNSCSTAPVRASTTRQGWLSNESTAHLWGGVGCGVTLMEWKQQKQGRGKMPRLAAPACGRDVGEELCVSSVVDLQGKHVGEVCSVKLRWQAERTTRQKAGRPHGSHKHQCSPSTL